MNMGAPANVSDMGTPAATMTAPGMAGTNTTGDADPAVTAVLDRLKQDSTPLSISDMSAAQDALARLNLLGEIEQKLSQIEETRMKRQFGGAMNFGAMPMPGVAAPIPMGMQSAANPMTTAVEPTKSDDEIQIISITGAAGKYQATLNSQGRTIVAKNGMVLPDGSKVTNIGVNGVSVQKKGKTSKLCFVQGD
jgi:type IV pilus biogenesis protein PilP